MACLERLRLAYRIMVDLLGSFRSLRGESFREIMCYVLTFGWVTALLSGALSIYDVDYTDPRTLEDRPSSSRLGL